MSSHNQIGDLRIQEAVTGFPSSRRSPVAKRAKDAANSDRFPIEMQDNHEPDEPQNIEQGTAE
jgi:hypothetical protein